MSTQSTSGQNFPAPCKRCGGALYQHADLCPYCGAAHPLAAPAHARFAPDSPLHRPLQTDPQTPPGSPDLASPETPIPPLIHLPMGTPVGSRWLITRGLIALGVVVLGYGGYALLGDRHTDAPGYDAQDSRSTAGSIAPYAPDQTANTQAGTGAVNTSATPTAPARAAIQPVNVPHYRDLADSLRAAHRHTESHDLSGAQAAVNAALSMEPGNADARAVQNQLTPLEQRRDAALQTANVCVKDHLWNCVEHSARDALSMDSGSPEAKSLLERAIVETGWVPLGGHVAPPARVAQPSRPQPAAPAVAATQVTPAAPAPGSVDAQVRAIAQSGWRSSPASAAAPAH